MSRTITDLIHHPYVPPAGFAAPQPGVFKASTVTFANVAAMRARDWKSKAGYTYGLHGTPTTFMLEERIAALEGGRAALAVASGHAAQLIALHTLMSPGSEIVAARQLYGGSINQFSQSFTKFDWHVKWADATDPDSFKAAVGDKTKAVFVESIANPGGVVTDLEPISRISHDAGVPFIVDNTLASPYLVRPIEWGADIVLHSATKFLGGHGTSMAGLIVDAGKFDYGRGKFPTLSEPCPSYHGMRLWETFGDMAFAIACRVLALRDLGPALSPMNAFLVLQGVETLGLRMERHCSNALTVARWLKANPKIAWVNYAGLEDNPSHARHKKYCPKGAGSVFTFGVKGGYETGKRLVDTVRLISHLANIGDTRSLIIHPASTTHRQLEAADRAKAGAGDDVVRLSIGIENVEDIIADLDQALSEA